MLIGLNPCYNIDAANEIFGFQWWDLRLGLNKHSSIKEKPGYFWQIYAQCQELEMQYTLLN